MPEMPPEAVGYPQIIRPHEGGIFRLLQTKRPSVFPDGKAEGVSDTLIFTISSVSTSDFSAATDGGKRRDEEIPALIEQKTNQILGSVLR